MGKRKVNRGLEVYILEMHTTPSAAAQKWGIAPEVVFAAINGENNAIRAICLKIDRFDRIPVGLIKAFCREIAEARAENDRLFDKFNQLNNRVLKIARTPQMPIK